MFCRLLFLMVAAAVATAAWGQSTFAPVWRTLPWDSSGLHPSSIVWSMVQNELDLDNDGKKEFLVSTAWSGTYHNAVYLYEQAGNNNFQVVWSYSFWPYSNDYSAVAVADLNGNGRKEILCLIDPAEPSYHGFYAFEWNGTDNGFPSLPTTTWNLGLPNGFVEGTAIIAGDFDNDGRDEVVVAVIESWNPPKSRVMIFSLSPGSTFSNPTWLIEFVDTTTFAYVGYALAATDLDRDGKKEIVAVGWDSLHIAIYEHTGSPNSYARVANIWGILLEIDFSNMGIVEANFDHGPTNELYLTTANGNFLVATNPGNVAAMTVANFTLLHQYNPLRGTAGMIKADMDGDSVPELYIAGSYHEAVFQWKYTGGIVTDPSSYHHSIIFQDDTTDSHTPGSDQGWFRPSKLAAGDFDGDGRADIVIASASFARDKPILMMIEQTPTSVGERNAAAIDFHLHQNYPNPFNPSTAIRFTIHAPGFTLLKVYDVLGREVTTLVDGELRTGSYEVSWDAEGCSSGIYLLRLTVDGQTQTRRMVRLQ